MTITIIVCCDDRLSCAGLRAIFSGQEDFDVVGEAVCLADAVTATRSSAPDVAVVSGPSFDSAGHRELASLTKVVAFTEPDASQGPAEAVLSNARAVLTPAASPAELMYAIRVVAVGDAVVLPRGVQRQMARMVHNDTARRAAVRSARLTNREADVLRLLAGGMSNADVARSLFVSAATVRCHVHRMLQKLGVKSRAQAVAVAYETGILSGLEELALTAQA